MGLYASVHVLTDTISHQLHSRRLIRASSLYCVTSGFTLSLDLHHRQALQSFLTRCCSKDCCCVVQVDPVRRMFDILRKENCFYVAPDDLKSMMAGILLSHPGLEFLQETPEFQDRYTAAVVSPC